MNATPLVSYLVPIYNVEKYLENCLESIFGQTYQNTEYVFVDDCSTDNSYDVLLSTLMKNNIPQEKYTIVRHPQNEGIAVSRADCVANAKGEYVQFVDSDDWIEPDMTETMVAATQNSQIDLIGCYYIKDFLSGKQTLHKENYSQSCSENMVLCINYDISTVLWKMLIKRSLFSNFTITPHVDIVEDYIISVKLYFYANSFAVVDRYMYHYVQYNEGRVSFQTLRSITNHIKGVKEVEEFLESKGLVTPKISNLLNLRKFNIKSNFLTKNLFDIQAYKTTFPEADKVWRQINYSRNEKIKFWLAEKKLYFILKVNL
ncbi:MAG: glycosyltransferase family 2 protein [Prevotella sp.]